MNQFEYTNLFSCTSYKIPHFKDAFTVHDFEKVSDILNTPTHTINYLDTAFEDVRNKILRLKAQVLVDKITELGLPVIETDGSYQMKVYADKCEFWYVPDDILIITFYKPDVHIDTHTLNHTVNISLNYK